MPELNRNTNKAAIKNDNIEKWYPNCKYQDSNSKVYLLLNCAKKIIFVAIMRSKIFQNGENDDDYFEETLDIQKKGIFFNIHTKRLFSPKLLNSNIYTWVSLGLINFDVYYVIHKFFLSISMIFRIFVFKSSSCPASEERTKIK